MATTNTGTAEPMTERFPPVLKFIFVRQPQMLQLVINSELSVSKTRLAPRRLSHIHPTRLLARSGSPHNNRLWSTPRIQRTIKVTGFE
jgi:hypothetical protein